MPRGILLSHSLNKSLLTATHTMATLAATVATCTTPWSLQRGTPSLRNQDTLTMIFCLYKASAKNRPTLVLLLAQMQSKSLQDLQVVLRPLSRLLPPQLLLKLRALVSSFIRVVLSTQRVVVLSLTMESLPWAMAQKTVRTITWSRTRGTLHGVKTVTVGLPTMAMEMASAESRCSQFVQSLTDIITI